MTGNEQWREGGQLEEGLVKRQREERRGRQRQSLGDSRGRDAGDPGGEETGKDDKDIMRGKEAAKRTADRRGRADRD